MTELNPFYSAKTTPEALEKMMEIREAYKALSDLLNNFPTSQPITADESVNTPPGAVIRGKRELALANTNLEQSAMWAIKSISHYNLDVVHEDTPPNKV